MMPTSKMHCYSAITRFERAMKEIKTEDELYKLYNWYRVIKIQLYNNKMDRFAKDLRDDFMYLFGIISSNKK